MKLKFDEVVNAKSLPPVLIGGAVCLVFGIALALFVPSLFPRQASNIAVAVDQLFTFMLVIGGAIFLLVQGVLLYSIWKFKAPKGDTSDGIPLHGNNALEFIWTLIPSIIVIILSIYSFIVWQETNAVPADGVRVDTIRVTAARFAWTFTYSGQAINEETGQWMDVTWSSPDLHLEVNVPVHLIMTAADVNHALWIPEMRVKQDLLVGRETELRFIPTALSRTITNPDDGVADAIAGDFDIVCAELCGGGHGNMSLLSYAIVHNTESYQKWNSNSAWLIANPPDDWILRGQNLLASGKYPCSGCHMLETFPAWPGNSGPNLTGVATRAQSRVFGQSAAQYLVTSIRHPQRYIVTGYGNAMPQFHEDTAAVNYMSDDDLMAIVAYLCQQTVGGEPAACVPVGSDISDVRPYAESEVTQPGTGG
jgi:cytochrome c oxidase subunit II